MNQGKIFKYYCDNDMRNLKKMCDELMSNTGGINGCDQNDYYSFANLELYKAVESYDYEKCNNFHNYFKLRLENRFRELGKIFKFYCSNNMRNLRKLCDKLMSKIGGIDGFERDDYYSLANMELFKAVQNYDSEKCNNFHNYFKLRLENRFKDHLRNSHRDIRCQKIKEKNGDKEEIVYLKPASLDAPIGDSESTLLDLISEVETNEDDVMSDVMLEYLKSLTELQYKILIMLSQKVAIQEIREKLGLTISKYNQLWEDMTSFEKLHNIRSYWIIF